MAARNQRRRRSGDLISSLPDHLIQHILSFLPSTKDAIRTTALSKRWNRQWTEIPTLIFDSTDIDHRFFCCFIERTLNQHDFPQIEKFVIRTNGPCLKQRILHLLPAWIQFAAAKKVRDLRLCFSGDINGWFFPWIIPQIVFCVVSLVNLELDGCSFALPKQFNCPSLKSLCLGSCFLPEKTVETVVSGCPVLESLEVRKCHGFRNLVVASKSLKRLVLEEIDRVNQTCSLKVECSNLDELELLGDLLFGNLRMVDLPDSTFVTLDFSTRFRESTDDNDVHANKWFEDFIRDVQHVKNLKCGVRFMRVLSAMEVLINWLNPLMKIKCLTVDVPYFHTSYHGIRFFLRNSPLLEKVVIRLHNDTTQEWLTHFYGDLLRDPIACCCLTTLKAVEIIDFDKKFDEDGHVLDFVKLLLQKAMVLEKIDIYQHVNSPRRFALTLSRELSRIPKFSPAVVVRFLCSTSRGHHRRQGWHANRWVAV